MNTNLELAKQFLCPPGATIQETLDAIGMSQAELAERMGRPKEKINELIKGKITLTSDTAIQLERVLGTPSSFWLNMERDYRDELAKIEQKEEHEKNKFWLKEFPILFLKKLKILPETNDKGVLVEHLLTFFGVASPEQWKLIYIENKTAVSFRISLAHTKSPGSISAWLRYCELQARKMQLKPFDKNLFKDKLFEIRNNTNILTGNVLEFIVQSCAKAGVVVVFTPLFPHSSISGASRWTSDRPLIQITDKFKSDDQFWFTFFHEAGHILLHGKKDIFLEGLEDGKIDKEKEEEADEFAADLLIPRKAYNIYISNTDFSETTISSLAKELNITPGVIVGRLQHDKHLPPFHLNNLKRKISFS